MLNRRTVSCQDYDLINYWNIFQILALVLAHDFLGTYKIYDKLLIISLKIYFIKDKFTFLYCVHLCCIKKTKTLVATVQGKPNSL